MSGWIQTTLLIVLSLLGAVRGEDTTPVDVVLSCAWCHPEETLGGSSSRPSSVAPAQAPDTASFTHEVHLPVNCEGCHVGVRRPDPENYAWCDGCHHREQSIEACARCHAAGPDPTRSFELRFGLPGGPEERMRTFPHDAHRVVQECDACHGVPPGPVEEDFNCASCHTDHHEAETVNCLGCHEPPPTWAHEDVVVHRTCAGGVCHQSFQPGSQDEWSRSTCEVCHPDFTDVETLPDLPTEPNPDTSATIR